MSNKKYVVILCGGSTYSNDADFVNQLKSADFKIERMRPLVDWKYSLQRDLGEDFDVLMPKVPCKENAKYELWKIVFEKTISKLDGDIILIGHSLGGIFLTKFLSENIISKKINQLHLVAAPFNEEGLNESLGNFIFNLDSLDSVKDQIDQIFIYQSKDDFVVPFEHAQKYNAHLQNSTLIEFEDKGHFKQENFPELVNNILNK